ncbi:uncharacterized protein si:dkey-106l3.7 [Brienomyrus brachyistius]|uniref:uncharacterized protein si:dkey-106l3.7 n=1 Tax=Brienomyrus brachyistius TaxID=42636 RepID=UPI0020B2E5BC|nr:uncharacterized protein si:dkey-106l3.7 [Brienomyrus brachyistius]
MYLYRNFGQIMEAYVGKNSSIDDSEDTHSGGQDSALREGAMDRSGVLLKSESEDSGVEEPVVTPLGSEQSFSLGKDPELADGPLSPSPLPSPSPARAPSLSSPPNLKGREGWRRVRTQVELALQRTKQRSSRTPAPQLPISFMIPQPSLGPSLDEGVPPLLDPEPCQQSQGRSEVDSQVCGEKADHGGQLSPGLSYLDEVCRLLEEIAKLQARNRELKRERDGLQYQLRDKERQELRSGQCLCGAAESASEGPAQRRRGPMSSGLAPGEQPAFRRRSMSDSEALKSNVERWKETLDHGSTRQLTEVDSSKQTKARQDRVKWQAASLNETSGKFPDPTEEPDKEPGSKQKLKKKQHSLFKRKSKNKSVK